MTAILCRTFDGDADWLDRAIPTWKEHCQGYSGIYITGIENECKKVQGIAVKHDVGFIADNKSSCIKNGYINQQYTKMRGDLLVDDEEILFVDSDTLCYYDHTPDIWKREGLPIMLYSDWSHVGDARCWYQPMLTTLGWKPPYEFMRRLPLLYHSDTIKRCREWIEGFHGVPLSMYLQSINSFSEFNVMGAFAFDHHPDEYYWSCPEKEDRHPNPFKQFWSHGKMSDQIDNYEHK